MAWRNIRLFLLNAKTDPDLVMRQLEQFRFDGEQGINKFETWDEFKETRIEFLFKIPRFVKIGKLEQGQLSEEKVQMDTISSVEIHIRQSGLVEAYGSPSLVNKAVDILETLGPVEQLVLTGKDFLKIMRMADDIRRVKIHGTDDKQVTEVTLSGGGLSRSKELKKYQKTGVIREITGKIELPGDSYSFAVDDSVIRVFVKDVEAAQPDIEFFISSLVK
ncbi:MAG: hypothetical protein GOU99_01835 [Candidatus Altiarchaeota archaeon]|nr:hypothetical protein [Candidatus Altiarchaeota archaeon]